MNIAKKNKKKKKSLINFTKTFIHIDIDAIHYFYVLNKNFDKYPKGEHDLDSGSFAWLRPKSVGVWSEKIFSDSRNLLLSNWMG